MHSCDTDPQEFRLHTLLIILKLKFTHYRFLRNKTYLCHYDCVFIILERKKTLITNIITNRRNYEEKVEMIFKVLIIVNEKIYFSVM